MGDIFRRAMLLLMLLALTCTGLSPCWIGHAVEIAQADEITIKRDDGTEESFRLSHDLIEKAMMLVVRFSPFVLSAWEGKVVEITRADEIKVMKSDLSVESVRLYGIDGPIEPNPFGKEAAGYTSKLALGKIVKVQPLLLPDPWSRTIAWVWINGESLNEELLKNGIVWWYRKYVPWEKGLAKLEAEAREARLGLWALPPSVPPWELQAIPAGQPASPAAAEAETGQLASPPSAENLARRGSVRERLISEEGAPRNLFGAAGSVRQRLKSEASKEEEPATTDRLNPAP
jgi:micrococcal nuclease